MMVKYYIYIILYFIFIPMIIMNVMYITRYMHILSNKDGLVDGATDGALVGFTLDSEVLIRGVLTTCLLVSLPILLLTLRTTVSFGYRVTSTTQKQSSS